MSDTTAVLLMAYGSPGSLDEVEPYYRHIRGGRTPTAEQVAELTERYRRVGGSTPLLRISIEVASALEQRLNGVSGSAYKVYVGMKHWHPFIAETVSRIAADGAGRIVAIPLAPHYSQMSTDGYRSSVEEAVSSQPAPLPVRFVESWHGNPRFVEAAAEKVRKAVESLPSDEAANVEVVFTAHSLPRAILQWDDPYPRELLQSSEAVAGAAGVASWRFAYQSASHTGQPWLGPDILECLAALPDEGKRVALVAPIGFVSDNLEILFDIDVEARDLADGLNIRLARTEMLNTSPAFIEALADVATNGAGVRAAELAP